jgi:hypothetical protein
MKFLVLLIIFLIFFACSKTNNNQIPLSGVYNEIMPDSQSTQLDFIDSNTVIVSRAKLSNQPTLLLGTNKYQLSNGQIAFFSDSASIKDTTRFWYMLSGSDSLAFSTCKFGDFCMLETFSYQFKK